MDELDIYQAEIMQEILEETNEYAENYQRSDEDGWFYPDEEGENW